MIVTARTGIAKPGLLSDAMLFTVGIVESMNTKFGVDFSLNIQVGGDPNAIHLVGRFDSMGDYQEFREAYMADSEFQEQFKQGAELADITEDAIGEIIIPAGGPDAYGVINRIQAISSNQPAAMEFLLRKITGDQSEVAFVISHPSLQAVYDAEAACLADERYLALYAESAPFMVPNSIHSSIRQRIV